MLIIAPGQDFIANGTFVDDSGSPEDPTTVTFKWKNPLGVLTTWVYGTDSQLTRLSTGKYQAKVPTSMQGRYWARYEGVTGSSNAAFESFCECAESEFVS